MAMTSEVPARTIRSMAMDWSGPRTDDVTGARVRSTEGLGAKSRVPTMLRVDRLAGVGVRVRATVGVTVAATVCVTVEVGVPVFVRAMVAVVVTVAVRVVTGVAVTVCDIPGVMVPVTEGVAVLIAV